MTETERERELDRLTERQAKQQRDRLTDRCADGQKAKKKTKMFFCERGRQTDKKPDR